MTPLAIRTRVGRLFGVHEWLLMALLALWTFAPVVWLLTRTHSGDLYTGADGPFAGDALQYLSWIRESGNHVLVANRFDTAPAGHVFLHPMFLLSGLLWKAGLPFQVAYLLWKPVAIVGVVAASAAYARRLLPERTRDVPLALVLALFFAPPTVAIADWLFSHPPRTRSAARRGAASETPVRVSISAIPPADARRGSTDRRSPVDPGS